MGTSRAITRPSDDTIVWKWENNDPFGANALNEVPSNSGIAFKCNLRFPVSVTTKRQGHIKSGVVTTMPSSGDASKVTRSDYVAAPIHIYTSAFHRICDTLCLGGRLHSFEWPQSRILYTRFGSLPEVLLSQKMIARINSQARESTRQFHPPFFHRLPHAIWVITDNPIYPPVKHTLDVDSGIDRPNDDFQT